MATSFEVFCEDYFVLHPEKASLFDLLSLLFWPKLENRGFIESPGRRDEHGWVIFSAVIVQKLLFWATTPMKCIGDAIETWLNLLSGNCGLFNLLLNLATGNIERPNRSSATFRSVIGYTDTRVELDQNIKPSDRKYKASLCIMASKISYENEAFIQTNITNIWKMKFVKFYNFSNDFILQEDQDTQANPNLFTQAFILQDTQANPNLFVVAFRGTSPFDADDWRTDADLSWCQLKGMCKSRTHSGFMQALGLQKDKGWPKVIEQDNNGQRLFAYYTLREKLREVLKENKEAKFILTGHSLGGALAILFAAVLMLHEDEELELLGRLDGVYTFGQPRVGDKQFGKYMKRNLKKFDVKYFRYVYSNDMVPRVPYDNKITLFKHFGPCLFFDSFYMGKVLREEPNKNYFSLPWMLPMSLTAVWELIRGFILPCIYGPDYKEGWFLRIFRVTGLLVPGVSAHCPQEYVNSTRLGNLPSDLELEVKED